MNRSMLNQATSCQFKRHCFLSVPNSLAAHKTHSPHTSRSLWRLLQTRTMPSPQPFATASSMLRQRLSSALRIRGASTAGPSRWATPGHEERPKGYLFNRTPSPSGQSRKWEDWELPCYITGFLTIVILGVGLNAKPDLTIETWAHQKALERLETEKLGAAESE